MQSKMAYSGHLHKRMKGQLADLPAGAMALGIFFIILAVVVLVLAGMNGSTTNTDAQSVLSTGITAVSGFADWGATFVVIIAAGVILALVMGYFYFGRGRRGGMA